jgi:hypothetical protein
MRLLLSVVIAITALAGCRTLDRFDTGDGEAYCGNIVSAAFIRDGFPPDLRLMLDLDTSRLESAPGTISSNDGTGGPCAPQASFENAPFIVTDAVFHDQLATLDFGEGRDANFVAWVQSTCQGPMLAVVSLMKSDDVEVRLMKPPVAKTGTTPDVAPGFALFQLSRQKADRCF